MNILDQILETKQAEIVRLRRERSFESIHREALAVTRAVNSFSKALNESASGIIAEFKRRSPSKGFIKANADVQTIVGGYAATGAAAISVLTDKSFFAGGLDDLVQARLVTDKPLLRKDFIIDPYQICEARLAGADVILLIAAALSREQCSELASFARSLDLEVLLELHGEGELDHLNRDVQVVGVNNRDLTTFVTDTAVSLRMAALLPRNVVRISESGISDPAVVLNLREAGYKGFLMGENFMKQTDPAEALGRFISQLEQ
jgi:indole-3-glycerol phosphate synthase